MTKRLPESQRFDRDYITWNLQDFLRALADENADKAEEIMNEITGTLYAMLYRLDPERY